MPLKNRKETLYKIKISIVGVCLGICLIVIIFKAFYLQIYSTPRLEKWAKRGYQKFVELSPQRGEIFDRNGNSLASSISVKSIYVNPLQIQKKNDTAKKLSKTLKLSKEKIKRKLLSDKHFVWLKRKVSPDIYSKVAKLAAKGLGAIEESKRFYPNLGLASNVIGFTGLDSYGLSGIELQYEKFLRSEKAKYSSIQDALGRALFNQDFFVKRFARGHDIYLTIDRTIQYIAETELDKEMAKTGAPKGYLIVMDPMSGKILAMVSRPRFNPNAYSKTKPQSWLNGTVSLVYEPGSTVKVFTIGAALEDGIIKPEDIFYCKRGSLNITGKNIRESSDRGWLTPSGIIKYSSNIGAAKIANSIGKKRLYEWFVKFGFGSKTGVDLPGEVRGILRPYSKWSDLELATIGFGQGVAVTPLQLVTALSSIANGGFAVQPYIVDKINDPDDNTVFRANPYNEKRIWSVRTANIVRNFMVGVTEGDGTGSRASIDGFDVAGKTGTTQKIDPKTHEYSGENITGSFMGFAPAYMPKVAVLVVIDEPKGVKYGGEVAAPVFKRVVKKTLEYMNVLPDNFEIQLADQKETVIEKDIVLVSNENQDFESESAGSIPDFQGLGIREVLRIAKNKGLKVLVKGSGVAFKQRPDPGRTLKAVSKCVVYFRPI